jgi:hypothetical protein
VQAQVVGIRDGLPPAGYCGMLTRDDNGRTMSLAPVFTITNRIAAGLTLIERARGFLEAATLSESWVRDMAHRAFVLEAHHTTHIEGTHLTVEQSERLLGGGKVVEADPACVLGVRADAAQLMRAPLGRRIAHRIADALRPGRHGWVSAPGAA